MMAQAVAERKSTTGPANCDPKKLKACIHLSDLCRALKKGAISLSLGLDIFVLEPDMILASSVFESQNHA